MSACLPIVFQITKSVLRCGYGGDNKAYWEWPLNRQLRKAFKIHHTRSEWDQLVLQLLRDVFVTRMKRRPRDHRVLVVVFIEAPSDFLASLGEGLLMYFFAPSVFILQEDLALTVASGQDSALVVDFGKKDTNISLVTSFNQLAFCSSCIGSLEFKTWDDDCDDQEGVLRNIVSCLRNCSPINRIPLVQNIIISGLHHDNDAFRSNLIKLLSETSTGLDCLVPHIRLCDVDIDPKWMSWVGGSVFSLSMIFAAKSISMQTFEDFPFVFDRSSLLHWDNKAQFVKNDEPISLLPVSPMKQKLRKQLSSDIPSKLA